MGDVIKHRMYLSETLLEHIKTLIDESDIYSCSDRDWPRPDETSLKLEVEIGKKYTKLSTHKLVSVAKVNQAKDAEGLKKFFHLTSDLRMLLMNIITINYKVKPL